jgi:hypothetical protein
MMKTLIHDTLRHRPWQPRHLRIMILDLKGAVSAMAPILGACSRFAFPALSVKYFADALMMDMANTVISPVQLNSPGGISR